MSETRCTAVAALQPGRTGLYRRHDLVWLEPGSDPSGRPWVVARRAPEEQATGQLRLGHCAPAPRGKPLRFSRVADASAVWVHRPPLAPDEILLRRPDLGDPWQRALEALGCFAAAQGVEVRIYGSLSWQALAPPGASASGGFLRADSDLDVLITVPARCAIEDAKQLLSALARLDTELRRCGGPALDGEVRLPDGGDTSWVELRQALAAPGRRVLLKGVSGVRLADGGSLLAQPAPEYAPGSAWLDACAIQALTQEALAWPKPGLVSPVDAGSHHDMDIRTLQSAIGALRGWFGVFADRARHGAGFADLAAIGRGAEDAMLRATHGVNAYRGALFHLGLLSAAAALCPAGMPPPAWVARHWSADILSHPVGAASHGAQVRQRDGAGGALREAANGYPTVTQVVLPALRAARARGFAPERARVAALIASIAELEDSNLLWRGGRAGLDWARAEARRCLRDDLLAQPDWRARLAAVHQDFVRRRLSPGGSADLLACALFLDRLEEA